MKAARSILTADKAIEIFKARPRGKLVTPASILLAGVYDVSSKTIRDIWTGRSWYKVTYPTMTPRHPYLISCVQYWAVQRVQRILSQGGNGLRRLKILGHSQYVDLWENKNLISAMDSHSSNIVVLKKSRQDRLKLV